VRAPAPSGTTEKRIDLLLALVGQEGNPSGAEFIRGFIEAERSLKPLATQVDIAKYAGALLPKLHALEKLLTAPPEGFTDWAFSPQEYAANKQAHGLAGVRAAAQHNSRRFREGLALLHRRTKLIRTLQMGRHGLAGIPQQRAAMAAAALMFRYGLPIAVDRERETTFSRAASIFFEEFTGQADKKIRRACQWMASFYHRLTPEMRAWYFEEFTRKPKGPTRRILERP
jgi:hypothetical protein